jgi:hypothetical protein
MDFFQARYMSAFQGRFTSSHPSYLSERPNVRCCGNSSFQETCTIRLNVKNMPQAHGSSFIAMVIMMRAYLPLLNCFSNGKEVMSQAESRPATGGSDAVGIFEPSFALALSKPRSNPLSTQRCQEQ